MRLFTFMLLIAPAGAMAADLPAARGVYTADLDRSANPCTDFYEFANGSWRANNPIPSSMVRWSRRWASGEATKDKLTALRNERGRGAIRRRERLRPGEVAGAGLARQRRAARPAGHRPQDDVRRPPEARSAVRLARLFRKRCVESTDQLLGEALGRKYTEKYFPPEAKARMQGMVTNLLWALGDSIRGLDWMSKATKTKALEKLATFNPKIGYPDKWKD
jgi:predicted metalloendopeptidase